MRVAARGARRGQLVHLHACGVLDLEDGAPAGADTLFRMWSMTKPIAGVAPMILYDRGVLAPDDPVAKFLPEYADQRVFNPAEPMAPVPAKRGITIRLPRQHHRLAESAQHAALLSPTIP